MKFFILVRPTFLNKLWTCIDGVVTRKFETWKLFVILLLRCVSKFWSHGRLKLQDYRKSALKPGLWLRETILLFLCRYIWLLWKAVMLQNFVKPLSLEHFFLECCEIGLHWILIFLPNFRFFWILLDLLVSVINRSFENFS